MTIANVTSLYVPRACVDTCHAHLRRVGEAGHEGLALWVGQQSGSRFAVSQTIIPRQRHIRTTDGVCVMIEPDELHRLNVLLYREKLTLIAQVHSHPGRAYHSSTDDEYAIATTVGCFSLVVPDFAVAPFDLARTATYRLDTRARWREVPGPQVRQLIEIGT